MQTWPNRNYTSPGMMGARTRGLQNHGKYVESNKKIIFFNMSVTKKKNSGRSRILGERGGASWNLYNTLKIWNIYKEIFICNIYHNKYNLKS